jgi:hypothetical protein
MLDISTLKVNDRVRLRRPVSGHDIGSIGTVVRVLRAHESNGKEVPAVIVAWHTSPHDSPAEGMEDWDGFTQHEQAMHTILEKVEMTSPVRLPRPESKGRLRENVQ